MTTYLRAILLGFALARPLPAHAKTCAPGELQGRTLRPGLYQLNGVERGNGSTQPIDEIADPAPPYIADNGRIEIYGTADYFLSYANATEFLQGGCYKMVAINLRGPRGTNYLDDPWDVRKFRIVNPGHASQEIIIGGTMSATSGRASPAWPDDNITRRIFFYRPDQILGQGMSWIRDLQPIVGRVEASWLGHSYGGNLLQIGAPLNTIISTLANTIGFFYERVSDDRVDSPYKTELFAQSMDTAQIGLASEQIPILTIGDHPYPSYARVSGGFLAEGPRAIEVMIQGQRFYLIGFSTGDFATDNYHMNFLWSRQLFGPYTPKLRPDGRDLLDLGAPIKSIYDMSAVGRPAFFQAPDGSYEMLFHGLDKRTARPNDFFRNIYKVGIALSLDQRGEPQIDLR